MWFLPRAQGSRAQPGRQHLQPGAGLLAPLRGLVNCQRAIEAGDQEELPEPEPEDGRVVQPPPPIASAIRGLSGEADGPRPVWSKPEGYKVEDGRIVAIAPDEARGYFRYIRSEDSTEEVTDPPMWPPPPRKRGDLDFPSGPIPSVEIYAEHHIAETDKANAAWKEQFELHEAKQPKMKLIDVSDMSRRSPDAKGSDDQEANNALVLRYTSPNADNIVPEEERTGLE